MKKQTFKEYLKEQLDKDGAPASYYRELEDFMSKNLYFLKQIYKWNKQQIKIKDNLTKLQK